MNKWKDVKDVGAKERNPAGRELTYNICNKPHSIVDIHLWWNVKFCPQKDKLIILELNNISLGVSYHLFLGLYFVEIVL